MSRAYLEHASTILPPDTAAAAASGLSDALNAPGLLSEIAAGGIGGVGHLGGGVGGNAAGVGGFRRASTVPPMVYGGAETDGEGTNDTPHDKGSGKSGKGERKRKRERDPNAPKRPMTAYFMFLSETRPEIVKALGEGSRKAVSEECARRWHNLSEEDKAVCFSLFSFCPCCSYSSLPLHAHLSFSHHR